VGRRPVGSALARKLAPPVALLLALLLATAFGWAAVQLHDLEQVRAPWLERWAQEHPGPREPDAQAIERVADDFAADRRADLFGLALGLGAGLAAVAVALAVGRREWVEGRGAALRVLAVGAVAGSAAAMASSLSEVASLAELNRWTLSDDSLAAYVGPLEGTVREWRQRIPDDHAVIVVGTNDFLLSRVGWALSPRPVHPLVMPSPPGADLAELGELASELMLGREAPGRWLVDLDALADGREALVRVEL